MSGATLIWVSWFLAGARLGPKFVVSYSFWFAAGLLVVSLLVAVDAAAMRLIEPDWFAQITTLAASGQDTRRLKALVGSDAAYALKVVLQSDQGLSAAIRAPGILWIASMAVVRGAFLFAWLLLFWNGCRKMLAWSWWRAAVALAVFFCLSAAALGAAVLIQMTPIMVDPGLWLEKWPFLRRWVDIL